MDHGLRDSVKGAVVRRWPTNDGFEDAQLGLAKVSAFQEP